MGGSVSAGHSNAELVYNLATQHAASKSSLVEQLMLGVDRRAYFLPDFEHFAYQDLAWKHNLIHLSAPVIYWEVLDQLQLKPGLSFLNLGSGTGYLSTMAGLILGPNGINHGVELHQEVIDFAVDKLEQFKQQSESMDRYEFCEPRFVQGNCLYLPPDVRQYDRVYVGAACPEDKETYMKNLLKVGGILVMPFRDYLVQIKRVGPNQFKTTRSMQVAFSSLQDPPVESGGAPVPHAKLPELHPRDLRDLARVQIRQLLRKSCETECPEVIQLKRFIPKRDVRSRLRVCSSNPGDMHQIISVGYSEQTDDDDNMSDNLSLEDHQHDDDDLYEVRTLDPPTDSEASNDETNPETKETSRATTEGENKETEQDTKGEDNDKLELEEKLENVLKVSKEEQSGKDEEKKHESKQKDREEEKTSRLSGGHGTDNGGRLSGGHSKDNGACSSKNMFRKSPRSSSSSNVQKYVDKEPLTKLESARKFKQLLDDITEIRCPGSSSRQVNERDEDGICDKLDSEINEKLDDGSQEVRSDLGSEGNRVINSETERDDIGHATEPTRQSDIEGIPNNQLGVQNNNSDNVDNNIKSVKNSLVSSENVVNKGAGNDANTKLDDSKEESVSIVKSSENVEEEPMDGVNDDAQDRNEKEGEDSMDTSSEHINALDTTSKPVEHSVDSSSEHINALDTSKPVATNDTMTPTSSTISFKREKTDSGVVDDDFVGDNNSNASLDSSGGSLDSGISYHSALNAYMESVREMKRTYANRQRAQSSFLKALMDSARDGEHERENGQKKTLGELFGDGACTFGDSSSRNEVLTNLSNSAAPSGNVKANLSNTNNSSSSGTNKDESHSCNAPKVSTNGAIPSEAKDKLDETMEMEQACSSKHTDQSGDKTDKRSSTSHAECNRESKNGHSSRHDNDADLSCSKKKKLYSNRANNRNSNRQDGKSPEPEEKDSNEEKLPYPTYAELQAMRQKLLAKIRDRSRATSSNDSSESDVESYLSNGRFENHSKSRVADQSSSSGQNENSNSEESKPSGRNEKSNSGTRHLDQSKPSGSKANSESKPSDANSSGDARMSEDDDPDGDTYESKRKYTTDSEHGDDEGESNDDSAKKESSKKNKKFKDRNTEEEEKESRRLCTMEAERLARGAEAAQRRDGLLNFLDEHPPARPLFHVFNRGMFEVRSPVRRERIVEGNPFDENRLTSLMSDDDDDDDFVLKEFDKEEEEEEADDGRPTYTSLMRERIQALPLPNLVKRYLNYDRDFE
uniref:Protein-L-isoaspartate O-methyltransferase domain-containing protein 2 n=1 Tax=Cacopsylla melanoneura TaxID=428564 RepID=A0A8D8W406_9HEMI